MNLWYNRKGQPVETKEGLRLFEGNRLERNVGKTDVVDTLGRKWIVSTVFLAIDHSFGSGPPLIFETMVFGVLPSGKTCYSERFCDRYPTEKDAARGHAIAVALVKTWGEEIKGVENEQSIEEKLATFKKPKTEGKQ
jgi:hypothetical protein